MVLYNNSTSTRSKYTIHTIVTILMNQNLKKTRTLKMMKNKIEKEKMNVFDFYKFMTKFTKLGFQTRLSF